jgi:tetratricopeptide (TPR) repeat protein
LESKAVFSYKPHHLQQRQLSGKGLKKTESCGFEFMKKVVLGLLLFVIADSLSLGPGAFACFVQTTAVLRPTALGRQLEKEEQKARSAFDREVNEGKAQPEDWEDRREPLAKRAAELLSGYQAKDWQDEELRTLARLLFYAREYARAIEADRKVLAQPAPLEKKDSEEGYRLESRFRLVNALLELEKIDEAASAFIELERIDTVMPEVLAARVFIHRRLTEIYAQNLEFEKAVRQAFTGYDVARRISQRPALPDSARQARDVEGPELIATAIGILARTGNQKLADDALRRWRQTARGRTVQAETSFENELATQRLIGRPLPELSAKTWIGGSPLTPQDLRGKVVLLQFWAMWNVASTAQFEKLNTWQSRYGRQGLQIIGVTRLFGRSDQGDGLSSKDELAAIETLRKSRGVEFPMAVAGLDDVTNDERFNATTLPMLILVDRQGMVRRIHRERTQIKKFEKELEKLAASREAAGK